MRVLERSARSPKRFLARVKIGWQAGWWNSRQSHSPTRNTPPTIDYLKAKAVTDFIFLTLVDLDQDIFLRLCRDLASRIDLRPIEDAELIETVLRNKQFILLKRSL